MRSTVVAAVDIGGTKVAVALGTVEGEIISSHRFPTRVGASPAQTLGYLINKIRELLVETQADVMSVGVGCAGPLDLDRGLILSPPNLPGWNQIPIVGVMEAQLGVPVFLDNDANLAALGELKYGAGRPFRNIVYITISTGIGGGVIVDGELVRGVRAGAGEVGHMTVLPEGPECACGARGCMESLCSGTSIARRARLRLMGGDNSLMMTMVNDPCEISAQTVIEASRAGDPVAGDLWQETISFLAIGIGNIIVTLAPEAVILGGGVSSSGSYLLDPLRARIRSRLRILPADDVQILQAALGGESGVYGALALGSTAMAQRPGR